jgi:hypothetical protein
MIGSPPTVQKIVSSKHDLDARLRGHDELEKTCRFKSFPRRGVLKLIGLSGDARAFRADTTPPLTYNLLKERLGALLPEAFSPVEYLGRKPSTSSALPTTWP